MTGDMKPVTSSVLAEMTILSCVAFGLRLVLAVVFSD